MQLLLAGRQLRKRGLERARGAAQLVLREWSRDYMSE